MTGVFTTLKDYKLKYLPKDIISGLIIALVSVPISMGYAQVAGLPAVYGLYSSVLPAIIFAIFSTSPQFIFGVDAAPAAIVGGLLATMGIAGNSAEAMKTVPVITFFTAIWLLLFSLLKAGKVVNFISTPVMGGFISGICVTIILMQFPKILGSKSGSGEIIELLKHIFESFSNINIPSLILGGVSLAILLISKKIMPKVPMAVIVMITGGVLQYFFHFDELGVLMLSKAKGGLPPFVLPDFSSVGVLKGLSSSITVAIVIMAETLLASSSYASKNDYRLNDNREILTYSLSNFASAFCGSCPVNGSVSRTSMNEQYGGKTQLTSIVSGVGMIFILLFGTGLIQYLPVPVLTAIVISALLGATEFDLAVKLYKVSRKEFWTFLTAFAGVLLFGTIYGVLLGALLSFISVIRKLSDPPRDFLGIIPGRAGYYNLRVNRDSEPLEGVIIYRFNANLFFANCKQFSLDIEDSIKENTVAVIVDAGGINSVDYTGAETLLRLYDKLKAKGIRFYITGHVRRVNDELRSLNANRLVEDGVTRRSIDIALNDMGVVNPSKIGEVNSPKVLEEEFLHEFEWAFGTTADEQLEKFSKIIISNIDEDAKNENIINRMLSDDNVWGNLSAIDKDRLLLHIELHTKDLADKLEISETDAERLLKSERDKIIHHLKENHPDEIKKRRHHLKKSVEENHPKEFQHVLELRETVKNEKENLKK